MYKRQENAKPKILSKGKRPINPDVESLEDDLETITKQFTNLNKFYQDLIIQHQRLSAHIINPRQNNVPKEIKDKAYHFLSVRTFFDPCQTVLALPMEIQPIIWQKAEENFYERMLKVAQIIILTFNTVSYTHLTLPTNREV